MTGTCLLVVAKAPVPGLAKTRLAATVGDAAAAEIAAAALLDTLDAVATTSADARVVAMTGDLAAAARSAEIRERLGDFVVIPQRGDDFADRLANAHADAAAATATTAVVQIGMDTPQVSPDLLAECVDGLRDDDAVLGLARDGGWWVLGVRVAAAADCLRQVPMSAPHTGAVTLAALRDTGLSVGLVTELGDVDTIDDVEAVRSACPAGSRFARITATVEA
ncbi:DUF2064 domain-containing protein [Mycolicibacterium sp. 3033]|nr:DUF2064 domain-containing protein [Mycolicibacterium aurantiacum]